MQLGAQWPGVEATPSQRRVHLSAEAGCVEVSGIQLFGLDFMPRTQLQEALLSIPDNCELLCLHALVKDVMGLDDVWTLDMDWVPERVSHTVLGDWHGEPQAGESNGRHWLYTGSSTMRTVTEPTSKSFLQCSRDGSGGFSFIRVPLKRRPFIMSEARFESELDEWAARIESVCEKAREEALANGIPDEVASPFVVLRYSVGIERAASTIESVTGSKSLAGKMHLHLMPNRAFTSDATAMTPTHPTIDLDQTINEAADPHLAPQLNSLVRDLAFSSEPRQVIQSFKQRHNVMDSPISAGDE